MWASPMQDDNGSNLDADIVREQVQSAVRRIRKKFSERIEPEHASPVDAEPGKPEDQLS